MKRDYRPGRDHSYLGSIISVLFAIAVIGAIGTGSYRGAVATTVFGCLLVLALRLSRHPKVLRAYNTVALMFGGALALVVLVEIARRFRLAAATGEWFDAIATTLLLLFLLAVNALLLAW